MSIIPWPFWVVLVTLPVVTGTITVLLVEPMNILTPRHSQWLGILVGSLTLLKGLQMVLLMRDEEFERKTGFSEPRDYVLAFIRRLAFHAVPLASAFIICEMLEFEVPWPAAVVFLLALFHIYST